MLASSALALAGEAPAKPCSYQDLMPAYGKFAVETAGLAAQQHAAAFVRDFAARYPDYYAPKVFGDAAHIVSLMMFDGHPTEFGDKHYLLFGVDMATANRYRSSPARRRN